MDTYAAHRNVSLRVYPSESLGFNFPVQQVDVKVHPSIRVLDLACDILPDQCVDEISDDIEELTLVVGGDILDGNATLQDALFPRMAQGRRTTVVLTPMEVTPNGSG